MTMVHGNIICENDKSFVRAEKPPARAAQLCVPMRSWPFSWPLSLAKVVESDKGRVHCNATVCIAMDIEHVK